MDQPTKSWDQGEHCIFKHIVLCPNVWLNVILIDLIEILELYTEIVPVVALKFDFMLSLDELFNSTS